MKLSKRTKDRLMAALAVALIIVTVLGVILIAKSCKSYEVTYYNGEEILKTEKVQKGEKAQNWRPDDTETYRVFECWVTEDGEEYDFGKPIEDDLKLYAKWYE